jgi:hypothetical protein
VETVTDIKNVMLGNWRGTSGRFTSSGTTVDVPTGLRKIIWFSVQGVDTEDNQVRVARNSLTTTDMGTTPGVAHCTNIASGSIYEFRAEGF